MIRLFRGEFATWLGINAANGVNQVELCGVQTAAAADLHLVSRTPRVALDIEYTIESLLYTSGWKTELSGFI